jgi:hypothetical protein
VADSKVLLAWSKTFLAVVRPLTTRLTVGWYWRTVLTADDTRLRMEERTDIGEGPL